jgi:hypothetical protein
LSQSFHATQLWLLCIPFVLSHLPLWFLQLTYPLIPAISNSPACSGLHLDTSPLQQTNTYLSLRRWPGPIACDMLLTACFWWEGAYDPFQARPFVIACHTLTHELQCSWQRHSIPLTCFSTVFFSPSQYATTS